jgi:hypothetical protein
LVSFFPEYYLLSIKVRNKWPPNLYPTSLTFDLSRKNDRSREKHGFYLRTHVQVRELRKEGPALIQYNSTNGYSITIGPLLA